MSPAAILEALWEKNGQPQGRGKAASCKETGQNCDFIIRGDTEEELLANAAQHGMDAHRIGAREDEAARAYGRDFSSAPGIGAGVGIGERDSWLQKVKGAIREE